MEMLTNNPKYRVLYAVWGFLECLIFGGLIYGWPSLVFVLKEEGLYSHLCTKPNSSATNVSAQNESAYTLETFPSSQEAKNVSQPRTCNEMEDRLSLVFTIGTAMFCVGCFTMGQINYKFGTRVTRIIATAIFALGSLLIAFTSNDVPWLIFPGLSLIGAGGIAFLMTNMQISILFPRFATLIVGLLCGAFDTSAGMQLLIKIGHQDGISLRISYIILACSNLVTLVSTFLFLPKDFIKKPLENYQTSVTDDKEVVELKPEHTTDREVTVTTPKQTLWRNIFSTQYLFHVFWLCILQLRFYTFLGSFNKNLEYILKKDEIKVDYYTNALTIVLMCGIFSSPLAGIVCDGFKRFYINCRTPLQKALMPAVIPLALTTTLCIFMSGLMLVEDSEVLIPVYLCLLFFRSFMYTLGTGYIGAIFPSEHFGILYGVLMIAGGVVGAFQHVFFNWAGSDQFFQVNLFLLILMFSTYLHPFYQWWVCLRQGKSRLLMADD